MATQREVKSRISSVKNIQKITRAMEEVSAARLRRAEQRIARAATLCADAVRRMTPGRPGRRGRGVSPAAHDEREEAGQRIGLLLVTADRGLAGAFNSQIIRAGLRLASELEAGGKAPVWFATGRRGVSSLTFRGKALSGAYTGFTTANPMPTCLAGSLTI